MTSQGHFLRAFRALSRVCIAEKPRGPGRRRGKKTQSWVAVPTPNLASSFSTARQYRWCGESPRFRLVSSERERCAHSFNGHRTKSFIAERTPNELFN